MEGWASDDENSFLFVNCNDDWDKGQDHYVFTPNGAYYFFIKSHKDYKGGFEPTQFRLSLENKTYYFKSNCVGGMGDLYDSSGKNLSQFKSTPEDATIDPSIKNLAINYYMKTLTGKGDVNSAIQALPLPTDRVEKAQACIQKRIFDLSRSLSNVYDARRKYRQVSNEVLSQYRNRLQTVFSTASCSVDAKVLDTLTTYLNML